MAATDIFNDFVFFLCLFLLLTGMTLLKHFINLDRKRDKFG